MLAVLNIIGVVGIGLPVALWLIARWRKSVPEKPRVYGEVNKWLLGEYGLGSRDRSRVQEAVLGRYAAFTALDRSPRGLGGNRFVGASAVLDGGLFAPSLQPG